MFPQKVSNVIKTFVEDSGKDPLRHWIIRISLILFLAIVLFAMNKWIKRSYHCRLTIIKNGNSSYIQSHRGQPYLAYIITSTDRRFNSTYKELTNALPRFFNIICKQSVLHNDSRIMGHGQVNVLSLILTHISIWDEIGSRSENELGENNWVFVFEDDIGVVTATAVRRLYRKIDARRNYAIPANIVANSGKDPLRHWIIRISLILFLAIVLFAMNKWIKRSYHCRLTIIKNGNSSYIQSHRGQPYLAYIITSTDRRFNSTYKELTNALPRFFNIICKQSVLHNDSRIMGHGQVNVLSLILTHISIWDEIGSRSENELGENNWVFVFEDDIGVVTATAVRRLYRKIDARRNYAIPANIVAKTIEEGLKLAKNDGILYLGMCGPVFMDNATTIQYSRDRLIQFRRGLYFCTHAIAYTKWRARRLWSDLATYGLFHREIGSDTIAREWQRLSKTYPLSAATNIHWPPGTGHYGLFFQDRGKHPSIIQGWV
ncbi:unnamed protein product [Rotaria magnacalcarata]|uniref:Uncharacterized protein n=1 Tax=Rotaria magnacalcarata TaxID=392030 RepID=A0A8S2PSD5_9BILA|nr:unnamed protein product [Rotaria magnacalcarata]